GKGSGPGQPRAPTDPSALAAVGWAAAGRAVRIASQRHDVPPSIDTGRYVDGRIDRRQYVEVKLIQEIDPGCCPPVVASPLGDEEAGRLADCPPVLADPARLRLGRPVASGGGAGGWDLPLA